MQQEEIETSEQSAPTRRFCGCRGGGSRLFLSITLIVAGLLLFLSNLGFFPLRSVWDLWPLVIISLGVGRWTDSRGPGDRVWAAAMVVFGTFFLAISLGFLRLHVHDGSWVLAIAFITFGVMALVRAVEGPRLPRRPRRVQTVTSVGGSDVLADTAVLGSVQRRIESVDFRGGLVTAVLGSVELDLRRAQVKNPADPVTLETTCVLGSIKLRIPETWRISVLGVPVMGAYEDKTIPVSRPDAITGTLVITGSCVLGSVEIES
jgi:Domain of unknown function (DUF5668)